MSLDHYVTLGRSGLRVSPFCLGAMTFGEDWGWGSSVNDAEAILKRYLERGGNLSIRRMHIPKVTQKKSLVITSAKKAPGVIN